MIKIGNNISSFSTYSCRPTSKKELKEIINERISKEGKHCNLNDIDTSLIEDMSDLFLYSSFTGDISRWNVSNVTDMHEMFAYSKFNGDISEWDVRKVKNMTGMFYCTPSFNCDISTWNIKNVNSMWSMFDRSNFNQNISNWEIDTNCDIRDMFRNCPIKDEFIPKSLRKCLR